MDAQVSSTEPTHPNRFHAVLRRITALLNDALLGFLALLAAELALAPALFALPASAAYLFDSIQWLVVGAFAVEYAASLVLASRKRQFIFDPWRLLDLFIIVVPVLSILPSVSNAFRSAPVLRLLRLLRLATFAARFSSSVVRHEARRESGVVTGVPEIQLFKGPGEVQGRRVTWDEFVSWLARPDGSWCHLSNVSSAQFDAVARAEGLSRSLLESCLSSANYPRLELSHRSIVLSVWLPARLKSDSAETERAAVLLVLGKSALMTVAPRGVELPALLFEALEADALVSAPFSTRLALALLRLVLDRNETVAGRLEQHLRGLEDVPVYDSKPAFFERAFRLRKDLSVAKGDLWRIKGVLATLAEGRVRLPGNNQTDLAETIRVLSDRSDYLYQTVDNLREGLLSVIELHLNVVSFEMNKFMRLLAVVSVLGLIPAVVGGLLGMNVAGNPWPATLGQITYGVCGSVLLVLYLFLVRGWLR